MLSVLYHIILYYTILYYIISYYIIYMCFWSPNVQPVGIDSNRALSRLLVSASAKTSAPRMITMLVAFSTGCPSLVPRVPWAAHWDDWTTASRLGTKNKEGEKHPLHKFRIIWCQVLIDLSSREKNKGREQDGTSIVSPSIY